MDVFAQELREFCDALGIEEPVVLGWSFGGMVAMRYAARFPEHPAKLILLSTPAAARPRRLVRAFGRLGGEQAAQAALAFWSTGGPEALARYGEVCAPRYGPGQAHPDELARTTYNVELLSDPGSVMRSIDLRPELARVTCPTLVVAGDVDPWGSLDAAAEIVAALPAPLVRYEQFEGAGHHIHHDDPDRLFEVLREFLAVPGPGTAGAHPRAGSVGTAPV